MSTVPTAVLFPGQGSQEPGMGRDVAEASKEAMELWKKAEQISGLPLRAVYWESDDAALMADTKHLQPALTVVNVTLWQALSGKLSPACAAGHSLGEYSALAAAGSLSPESALELVSLRGKLMADADPDGKGGMAAILKLNREAVNEIAKAAAEATGEILIVANHNTPAQFAISGAKAAVEAALPLVKEKKRPGGSPSGQRSLPQPADGYGRAGTRQGAQQNDVVQTAFSRLQQCDRQSGDGWRKPARTRHRSDDFLGPVDRYYRQPVAQRHPLMG